MTSHIEVSRKDAVYYGGILKARDAALVRLGPLATLTRNSQWSGDWSESAQAWRFEVDVPDSPEGLLL